MTNLTQYSKDKCQKFLPIPWSFFFHDHLHLLKTQHLLLMASTSFFTKHKQPL